MENNDFSYFNVPNSKNIIYWDMKLSATKYMVYYNLLYTITF